MSNTKIVIDKEDFEQKIIGWIERRDYVTKSDILALFQDLTTEIQIDKSIEERAKIHGDNFVYFEEATDNYRIGATQQQIIEQLKVKDKLICDKEWNEKLCDNCEFLRFNIVGHPGGSNVHTAKQHYCELGFFKEDF